MKYYLRTFSIALLILLASAVNASSWCPGGKVVKVTGEINNNAIATASPGTYPGQVTLGVARLRLFADGTPVNLTCTLLGEPTGADNFPGNQTYDHIITCDDAAQSELSFKTYLTGIQSADDPDFPNLLPKKTSDRYCNSPIFAFTEKAAANPEDRTTYPEGGRTTKGIFSGAEGSLYVGGCVNFVQGNAEINMAVGGKLCLNNW